MKSKLCFSILLFLPGCANALFSDNLRWALDASIRHNQFITPDKTSQIYFFGLDSHKVFSNENGDLGYSVMQFYYTRLSDQNPYPFMFDSPDDGKVIVREAHLNYTQSKYALPNVRIGHFTMPFGLEDSNDTNGRLLDYGHSANLGTKLDWGILINKVHDTFEYKVSYTLGGKDDPKSVDGSSLVTGRFSTLSHYDYIFGLSFYNGELDNIKRKRIAFDLQYYIQTWGVKAELAQGELDNIDESYALFEINKHSLDDAIKMYGQYIYTDKDSLNSALQQGVFGLSYQLNTQLEASIEYKKQIKSTNNIKNELFRAQIRYRY
ncbi:hypothetical protein [Pseudoalteromonas denitrificans]|uniref:Porin n=1 Tax=Pseudoalteromonas denitrificans DSM 6059 TaxID=1123010 RepID=A0A1I1FVN1_9GAMM|nr:hypothetical protein [Pseudoalteromonas denitrificans]SFC01050.1 hypothetical protein SAMN02745724_00710 [Pseudoalteromonas denitrificans DSM 6059]